MAVPAVSLGFVYQFPAGKFDNMKIEYLKFSSYMKKIDEFHVVKKQKDTLKLSDF